MRVQDDLRVVLLDDARAEVEDQVHEEEGVRHDVKDYPGWRVLVLKEGDAHGDDDEVSHHQQQHCQIPVEPERWTVGCDSHHKPLQVSVIKALKRLISSYLM